MLVKFVICLGLFIIDSNADVVSFIDPCTVEDSECILKSAKKAMPFMVAGIPELGVPSADPLRLDNTVNADNQELKLTFKDLEVYGLPKCVLIKIVRSTALTASLEMDCPITAKGLYEAKGKIFVIDLFGNGGFEVKTDNMKLEIDIEMKEIEGEDGKAHYKIKKFHYKYLPIEKFYFKFDNLYNGDKAKAEPLEKIFDESWLELINKIGKPVMTEIITKAVNVVDKFFLAVPHSELQKL